MTLDVSRMLVDWLRISVRRDAFRRVLDALAAAIHQASEYVDDVAARDPDGEWTTAVAEDECDLVENLLGAAFVVCQTQITEITAVALRVAERGQRGGKAFPPAFASAKSLRLIGADGTSRVEQLWAFANFFKHRAEWGDWSALDRRSHETARVVRIAGVEPGSTGNLRTGAAYLGNPTYVRLDVFADIVDEWAGQLVLAAETALA